MLTRISDEKMLDIDAKFAQSNFTDVMQEIAEAQLSSDKVRLKELFGEIEVVMSLYENELGFAEISNHVPYSEYQSLKKRWLE